MNGVRRVSVNWPPSPRAGALQVMVQVEVAVGDVGEAGQDEPGHEDQEQSDEQDEGEGERGHGRTPFRRVRPG
ncbi:hypothetical protein ACYCCF_30800 [Streptomyces argenteolus]|uniref:hypothetical protein n=1 Tax=Streptomyces sp. NPDC025273 TaxID=3155251 RepID=UPI0033CBE2F0